MTIREAKQIPIVDFLAASGHTPSAQKGNDYWYMSPLRSEKSSSFKIDTARNIWYDHGLGIGGTIIDLVQHLHNVDTSGALSVLRSQVWPVIDKSLFSFHQQESAANDAGSNVGTVIESVKPLSNLALIRYLESRFIPVEIGRAYLSECYYSVLVKGEPKRYFGLAFQNDLGGYELRHKFGQSCSKPKAITTLNPGRPTVVVFEGFFDMLSAFVHYRTSKPAHSIIVLNSLALLQTTLPTLGQYERVNLFLDNDKAGHKAVEVIQQNHSCVTDYSTKIYPNHKDFNELLINE